MTSIIARFFQQGTYANISDVFTRPTENWCNEARDGYYCSLPKGHDGPQHVASRSDGYLVRVWDAAPQFTQRSIGGMLPEELTRTMDSQCDAQQTDGGRWYCSRLGAHQGEHVATREHRLDREIIAVWPQAEQPEPEDEVTTYKREVRAMAERKLRDGYGEVGTWNATLKRLGIEPITRRKVMVWAPVQRVGQELRSDISEQEARDWLTLNRHRLATYLRPQEEDLNPDEATVEVEETAEVSDELDSEPDSRAGTTDLDEYKQAVKEAADDLQRHHGWCDSGTEEVLRELGITSEREYLVWVTVTTNATQRVGIRVTAASEDDAAQQVSRYSVQDKVDSSEWDISDNSYSWDWEVDEVEED